MSDSLVIFLIAGEASGDQLGADLMVSLKKIKDVQFAGIGGEAMESQGFQSLFPMEELSIVGLSGILRNVWSLRKRLTQTVQTIQTLKPDIVITIDAPEFSFRVLKRLRTSPHKPSLIHYVAPTVWAWRPGRAKKIARFLDHLLCLYHFEPPYFERVGLQATFVGHPIGKKRVSKQGRDPNLLCVLPGSRRSEIDALLPIFKETVVSLKKDFADLKVIIPTLPALKELIALRTSDWPLDVRIVAGEKARDEAFQKSQAALAASGTVALQLAAANLPFVIAYKIGKISGWLARPLIKTPWACMVNILLFFQKLGSDFVLTPRAKEQIPNPWIPEFIQEDCTSEKIAPVLAKLLKDPQTRKVQVKAMEEALSLLKAPPDLAAQTVLQTVDAVWTH